MHVAIVGFGSAGHQHADALRGLPGADLACIFDERPDLEIGGARRAASFEAILDDAAVDAVALCVPPGGRAALATRALLADKAVLLEKPPCTSEAELDELLALAERQRRPVGVMFQHRFRLPDAALTGGWDGRTVALLEVSRPRDESYFERTPWRRDAARSGGGITAHLGVHSLDLACQLLGEPARVQLAGRRDAHPGVDVRLAGTVEFTSGAVLAFAVTGESAQQSERLVVMDTTRRLVMTDGAVALDAGERSVEVPAGSKVSLRQEAYADLANAHRTGTVPARCGLERSRGVTRVLEQIATGGRSA